MPRLAFSIESAQAVAHAAAPTIAFELVVERVGGDAIRSATVGVRVDIAPARRAYDAGAEARLAELFGAPAHWDASLGAIPWARTTVLVGPVADRATVELPVACTYDFDVASAKYLDALRDGEIPLDFSFSGTVLYDAGGFVQAAPIPWSSEASYRLPVAVWRQAMAAAFGDTAWIRLPRNAFDRLQAFRVDRGLTSWESAIETLLDEREGAWIA